MLNTQFISIVCALQFLVAGCMPSSPAKTNNLPPIRIGASYWPGQFWVDIAHHQGWFKEAGLNVEWIDTNADYFASFDHLVHGKLDIVAFTLFDLTLYQARGNSIVGFLASDYSSGADALIVRPGINTVRDLAGKKIGLAKGTYVEYIWTVLLGRYGVKPESVHIENIPGEKASEALLTGRVDAMLTWEPFADEAMASVKGDKIFDSSQIPGISWVIYTARSDFLRQRSTEIHQLMQVWKRTNEFIQKRPLQAYAIVADVNHKTVAEVIAFSKLDKVLNLNENRSAFSYASGFDSLHGSARRMNSFQIQAGLTSQQIETPTMLNSLFIDSLTRRETN
jgi:NitT/TauT family transport system substrate-binding protein